MKNPICSCTEVQWKKRNSCTSVHSEIVTNLSETMCASSGPTRRIHLRRGMVQFSSVQSLSRVWLFATHRLQHARPPCPSPTPGVYSNSCLLSQWCHPTISSSVIPFSSCLQSFPTSGSFPTSQFFTSGGQSIRVSAWVLPMNIQYWFRLGLTGLISLLSKGLSRIFSSTTIQKHQFSVFFFF